MAIGRRERRTPATDPPPSLIASAARVTLNRADAWRDYKLRDEEWQSECWRMYDVVGELHFAANYIGSACSRVRIYVAEVDDVGRIGEEVSDDEVQALADTVFGGPAAKAEALRALGVNLTVPGEAYIIGRAKRSRDDSDRWFISTASEIKRQGGRLIIDTGSGKEEILPERDIVIRVWTPHPRRMKAADSPTRAALPILREIEQLTKFVFSQIDSRLAGAGILPIPSNVDFPGSGDAGAPGAEGLMQALTDAASASLSGHGSAAALVPILVEMPIDAINAMPDKPIRFESELSEKAKDLRDEALRRLSLALDMPPEVLTGTGDTNHWSAWHIEESAVKIHVEPLMNRICHALTEAYLAPAVKALGKDPKAFAFAFDTAPLTVRPDRLKDTLMLYEQGVVNADAVLRAGDYHPELDAPTEEEENAKFLRELMLRDPTLVQVPGIREAAGLGDVDTTVPMPELPPGQGDLNAPGPPPPPAPDRAIDNGQTAPMPDTKPGGDNGLIAATQYVQPPSAALVAADALVTTALDRAGKRLLTREHRAQWQHVPAFELHTKIRVQGRDHVAKLMAGAWDRLPATFADIPVDQRRMRDALDRYCTLMLTRSMPHHRSILSAFLTDCGLLR